MPRLIDITGQRFGRLTVVAKSPSRGKQTRWMCVCNCGREVTVWKTAITSGAQVSCGCYMRERAAQVVAEHSVTHGMRHSPEYTTWSGIRRRCLNQKDKTYPRYGGSGVRVLFDSFEQFYADIGPKPGPEYSVDRIDPHGHYEPGNVQWATAKDQQRNKKNTLYVEFRGERKPLKAWCEELGLKYGTVWLRIKQGVSVEVAFRKEHLLTTAPGLFQKKPQKQSSPGGDATPLRA
jgi:hypothetical protein